MFNWFNMNKKTLSQQVLENSEKILEILERGLFDYQGEYNTNTIYKKNDCVKYNNTLYIYKNNVSSKGILPTNTEYWDIFQQDTGTLVKDVNGNSLSICSFSGHNGINVDMDEEDPNEFNIRLDNEISNKINRSLLLPISAPQELSFVAVEENNSEVLLPYSDVIKDRRFLQCFVSNYQEVGSHTQDHFAYLSKYKEFNNDCFSLNTGKVIIGNNVNKIKVDCTATLKLFNYVGNIFVGIYKNGVAVSQARYDIAQARTEYYIGGFSAPSIILDVENGDEISLGIYEEYVSGGLAIQGYAPPIAVITSLLIEAI